MSIISKEDYYNYHGNIDSVYELNESVATNNHKLSTVHHCNSKLICNNKSIWTQEEVNIY